MIGSLNLEVLIAAAGVGVSVAVRNGLASSRRRSITAIPAIPRSIGQLPYRHRRVARAIAAIARECLVRHPHGSLDAFTARETVSRYLPETLDTYFGVPRTQRRLRPAGGRSADDELCRQLRTLRHGLDRIAEADADAGRARMLANGAFLEQRFGPARAADAPLLGLALVRTVAAVVSTSLRRT